MLLSQIDPNQVAEGLTRSPLAWGCALLLLAVAYLFKTLNEERKQTMLAVAQCQAALVESIKAAAKEQREILSQIVPLSSKLTEGLEILERLTKD